MNEVLVAPTMETGTKEHIKQKFGYHKTKEIFASGDGLVERQNPFLAVARPIAAALERLEETPDPDDEVAGPDPDEIKVYLEDSLVLLGNANFRLNSWRQKRFAEYLTDVGKRILKEDIPTDKHLFPDRFHQVVRASMITRRPTARLSQPLLNQPFRKRVQNRLSYLLHSRYQCPTPMGKTRIVLQVIWKSQGRLRQLTRKALLPLLPRPDPWNRKPCYHKQYPTWFRKEQCVR